ncbi:MAG: AAA family ATPase [Bacteroidetes bacterium B1(2017)]|nr:MAG: AAA family ATPase [Bacteroidetes bacterium B1(2017)]
MDTIPYKTDESEIKRMYNNFVQRVRKTKTEFVRYLMPTINWEDRFIAIRGARGCGKTTLLHQYIKLNLNLDQSIIYVSLDDVYFSNNRLIDFVDDFVLHGGTHLFLDEVHKYPSWSNELKSIYDNHSELKIVFTSSSVLNINKGSADLSRRVVVYDMDAMSFREFMNLSEGSSVSVLSLNDLLKNHLSIANEILMGRKVIPAFKNYLDYGAYPFFIEGTSSYAGKLAAIVNLTLETDLPAVFNMEYRNVFKLKKLVQYLAVSGPYKPDITKLAAQLEVSRNTLLLFLSQLDSAHLLKLLKTDKGNESILTKPEKVYMNNSNLMNALSAAPADIGAIREVFFFHQMGVKHKVTYTPVGDFFIDDQFTFEVGGKNKTFSQIKQIKQSYIAIDGVETGMGNKIPLWMFGLLY